MEQIEGIFHEPMQLILDLLFWCIPTQMADAIKIIETAIINVKEGEINVEKRTLMKGAERALHKNDKNLILSLRFSFHSFGSTIAQSLARLL